jgi:hypothetical protein
LVASCESTLSCTCIKISLLQVESLLPQASEAEAAFPELSDPTERVAARLGLDYKLLSHHTGLLGTDVNGAVARLRFMLAHSGSSAFLGAGKVPKHQALTTSAALKQRAKKVPDKPVFTIPTPPSKHEQQVRGLVVSVLSRALAVSLVLS